jgi:hypothetical protein
VFWLFRGSGQHTFNAAMLAAPLSEHRICMVAS